MSGAPGWGGRCHAHPAHTQACTAPAKNRTQKRQKPEERTTNAPCISSSSNSTRTHSHASRECNLEEKSKRSGTHHDDKRPQHQQQAREEGLVLLLWRERLGVPAVAWEGKQKGVGGGRAMGEVGVEARACALACSPNRRQCKGGTALLLFRGGGAKHLPHPPTNQPANQPTTTTAPHTRSLTRRRLHRPNSVGMMPIPCCAFTFTFTPHPPPKHLKTLDQTAAKTRGTL